MNFRRLAIGIPLLLGGCAPSFLDPAGPIASAETSHFWFVGIAVLVVIIPLFIGLPLFLMRYRHDRPKGGYHPDWDFDWRLEIVVWGIPAVIVAVLGTYLWFSTHQLDPYRPIRSDQKPLEIQAIAYDWKWLFIYPDQHIATVNHLVIPVDRQVHFRLTSATVMQSFMIPQLGGQVYAMNDMTTQLYLMADRKGRFYGYNTQYNGTHFPRQHFSVLAVTPAQFRQWATKSASAPPLTPSLYRTKIAPRNVISGTPVFTVTDTGLFDRIAHKDMPHKQPITAEPVK